MKACGLIVEYNPFHNGHLHHLNESKVATDSDCMIAIMSGPFLQRGEPAIIDKFHRAKAALLAGVDIVLELPYAFAVQHSNLFAQGAISILNQIGVSQICFGSESGDVHHFLQGYDILNKHQAHYKQKLQTALNRGSSFPVASATAYQAIGLDQLDLQKPNNILGLSYIQAIKDNQFPITPFTITRIQNHYHDQAISGKITSATSIRNEMVASQGSRQIEHTLPPTSLAQINDYKSKTSLWHTWEAYFPYLHYKVLTSTPEELAEIHGVEEGIEHRIKRTAHNAKSFADWLSQIKTRRYTTTRIQRIFTHILTNTRKAEIQHFTAEQHPPYVRVLGMSPIGRNYLNQHKHKMDVPMITNLNKQHQALTFLDERAQQTYYSILHPTLAKSLRKQAFNLPIFV